MAYRIEDKDIIIDGFEKGIASSPYLGITGMSNVSTTYYPGVAYTNYRRQAATLSGTGFFYAGSHSTDEGNNNNWIFGDSPASPAMTNPVSKAQSPAGINYIQDDIGQIWKQNAVNSSTFTILDSGTGRIGDGNAGIAYWNNYLVVFGDGLIEFCGDGTGDAGIISSNWNLNNSGAAHNTAVVEPAFSLPDTRLFLTSSANNPQTMPRLQVNDPVQFTTTGTLPGGLSLLTTYYILTVDTSANTITVSTSVGGSAVSITTAGSGTHTLTDYSTPLPLGNCTSLNITFVSVVVGATSATINSYVNPSGVTVNSNWQEATGTYNIIMSDNQKLLAVFTNGSATITLIFPLTYSSGSSTNWQVQLLNTTVTNYKPYVSKVDGNLYFANNRALGRILSQNENIMFNPGLASTFDVNAEVVDILQPGDSITSMTDLTSTLIISGLYDIYTWDYISASVTAPTPVGERIYNILNLLSNIYIFAGKKGNIYFSNGYSAQLLTKMPDSFAGVMDPIWLWGDYMIHRSKLFFQAIAQTVSGTNILAGIFSLIVSKQSLNDSSDGFTMEAQNSYGLTPTSGALSNGLLIDNQPFSAGSDSYYSAWSNGAITGGIDYNDTSGWQNFEPTIETDIIPIGTILNKLTFGNIEFKLDRPMVSGDQIRMYWRPSVTDSYILMGTTTTTQLSDYYPSNISQSQWAQFKVQYKCASSGSSFIPLREIRLHYN